MLVNNYSNFPMASVFVQWLHAHIGLITYDVVLMNFFLTIKKLLPIYHD